MERKDINRLNSSKLTRQTLLDNAAATAAISGLPAKLTTLGNKILIVESNNIIGAESTHGVTLDIETIRKNMMLATFVCSNGLVAFASDAPINNALRVQAKTSITKLKRLSKEECGTKCKDITDLAFTHATDILPKGVSATDISDAQNLVSVYLTALNDPQGKIADRKSANNIALTTLNQIMNELLPNSIDPLINTLITTNNTFWKLYFDTRKIINVGEGTTRITFELKIGTVPVNAAAITLVNKKQVAVPKPDGYPTYHSDELGNVTLTKLGTGLFDITIETPLAQTKILKDINIKLGENLHLGEVQLSPILKMTGKLKKGEFAEATPLPNGYPLPQPLTVLKGSTNNPLSKYLVWFTNEEDISGDPTDHPTLELNNTGTNQSTCEQLQFSIAKPKLMLKETGTAIGSYFLEVHFA